MGEGDHAISCGKWVLDAIQDGAAQGCNEIG
jgi:hypothetical protein